MYSFDEWLKIREGIKVIDNWTIPNNTDKRKLRKNPDEFRPKKYGDEELPSPDFKPSSGGGVRVIKKDIPEE